MILLSILLLCTPYWIKESKLWLAYLVGMFIFSLLEYTIHRFALHSRKKYMTALNKLHMYHHGLSRPHCYYFSDKNHAATILLGPLTILYIILGVATPLSYLVGFILGDVYFFVCMSSFASYLALYETVHFLCHIEKIKKILPFKLTDLFIERHISHHKEVNSSVHFGIVPIFWDDLFKTIEDEKASKMDLKL